MFKLHPDAANALEAIAADVAVSHQPPLPRPAGASWGEPHISARITDKDIIGAFKTFEYDGSGAKVAFRTRKDEVPVSIEGDDFTRLQTLVKRVLGISALRDVLSEDYVETLAINWCVELRETMPFSAYLSERVRADVSNHQIWVPVSDLQVQEDFHFGQVRIITIGRRFLDSAETSALSEHAEHREEIAAYFAKLRGRLQGNAAVAVSVKGEPRFASKQAQILAEAAVGLLRFFHMAGLTSKFHSPVALLGSESVHRTHSLRIAGVDRFDYLQALKHPDARSWRLPGAELAELKRRNLELAGTLISDDSGSEFADRVRSSLLTYSKGMTFAETSDRLVYSFSALEGLFLKDGSEPITQNVAERVAFSASRNPDERMDIVKNFRTVYAARSQYIHHRQNKALPDGELDKFFITAWTALYNALANTRKFAKTADFLQTIERMKFS